MIVSDLKFLELVSEFEKIEGGTKNAQYNSISLGFAVSNVDSSRNPATELAFASTVVSVDRGFSSSSSSASSLIIT